MSAKKRSALGQEGAPGKTTSAENSTPRGYESLQAALEAAIATARTMKPRAFDRAKSKAHPRLIYCLHGTGTGQLIALDRDYRPAGCETRGWSDYAAPEFAHLRTPDTAAVRALATSINEFGRLSWPSGSTVPILYVLDERDTSAAYCRRLRSLIEAVQHG
jgi:hypothetical protein